MKPNKVPHNEKENLRVAADFFAEQFVKQGEYPDEISSIEISLYSIPGRDVL